MSRIGKRPIPVPTGVTVTIEPEVVRVAGPRGDLQERKNRAIEVRQEGEELIVTRPTDRAEHRALHGLTRSLIANMVTGVTDGFSKTLEIQGVGYRAQLKGANLELALGYSHAVPIKAPQGIEFEVPQPTRVVIKGNSKQQVGEVAAVIRKQRPPEPYKGKGIRYEGEYVARKVGKRACPSPPAPPSGSSAAAASARRSPAPPSGPGSPCSAPTAASSRSSSTTRRAARWPPSTGPRTSSRRCPAWSRPSARASCSPSAPRPPGSSQRSSAAAATATTVASGPSPRVPARAA